jgi:hypothetical protein
MTAEWRWMTARTGCSHSSMVLDDGRMVLHDVRVVLDDRLPLLLSLATGREKPVAFIDLDATPPVPATCRPVMRSARR